MNGNKWKSTDKTEILDDNFLSTLEEENKKRYGNNHSKSEDPIDIEILDDELEEQNLDKKAETISSNQDIETDRITVPTEEPANVLTSINLNQAIQKKNFENEGKEINEEQNQNPNTNITNYSDPFINLQDEKSKTIQILNEQVKELSKAHETIEESIELLIHQNETNENKIVEDLSSKINELSKTSKNLENTIDLLRLDIPNQVSNKTTLESAETRTSSFNTNNDPQTTEQKTNIYTENIIIESTDPKDVKASLQTIENEKSTNLPEKQLEAINNSDRVLIENQSKKKKWPWIIILVLCTILIAIFTYKTFFWQRDSQKTNKQIEQIVKTTKTKESIIKKENIVGATTPEDDRYFNYLDVDFQNLKIQNSDVKGWIKVNNTNINYPFVQSETNDFYLNHSFDKSFNTAGWVFADFRNKFDELDQNTILYAHGRLDDTMFGSLKKIVEKNWYENMENEFIQMSTLESNTIWQVFSVYTIEPEIYYITPNFETSEEIQDFFETLKDRSVHDFKVELNTNDKILTLSSCYNDTLRIVLHAKLVNIESKEKN